MPSSSEKNAKKLKTEKHCTKNFKNVHDIHITDMALENANILYKNIQDLIL